VAGYQFLSSFFDIKLDTGTLRQILKAMAARARKTPKPRHVTAIVRQRIAAGGERVWKLEDFDDLPFTAVAQALSRMTKAGEIERLSKGVYYCGRETTLGKSRPNPAAVHKLASRRKTVFPAGMAAANLLGFTTQTARRRELATSALSLPRKLVGRDAIVHTRRPEAWSKLNETEAALLDFLRRSGSTSELPPKETIDRMLALLSEDNRYCRLLRVVDTEPPRVRAILGALGEKLGRPGRELKRLKKSLNPLSRFNFSTFSKLDNARDWQAKGFS